MELFRQKVAEHIEHVKRVGNLCSTEETTKQALILPALDILGFSAFDPSKVKAEYQADFVGAKAGERVDYALFCHDVPVMFVEAKAYSEDLNNHCPQLSRYFNATPEVAISIITNGKEWRFFTDLNNKNVMDSTPFLTIDLFKCKDADVKQLYQFRHDHFQPDALRTLAEESVYELAFTQVINDCLKDLDVDFVKFVASKANIQRQLNQKFVESITPLVGRAIQRSVSEMVVFGLSSSKKHEGETEKSVEDKREADEAASIVDPDNEKIVTTYTERLLFDNIKMLLGEEVDLQARDTETYFSVAYQGKSTRWLVRYFDSKQRPTIQFPFPLNESALSEIARAGLEVGAGEQVIIDRPENILRLPGLIFDAYQYCSNDENFKRKQSGE